MLSASLALLFFKKTNVGWKQSAGNRNSFEAVKSRGSSSAEQIAVPALELMKWSLKYIIDIIYCIIYKEIMSQIDQDTLNCTLEEKAEWCSTIKMYNKKKMSVHHKTARKKPSTSPMFSKVASSFMSTSKNSWMSL